MSGYGFEGWNEGVATFGVPAEVEGIREGVAAQEAVKVKRMLERPFREVDRQPIVDRSRFNRRAQAERWTGALRVVWAIELSSPVVIGAGWIGVEVEKGFRKRAGRRLAGVKGAVFEDDVPEAEIVRRGEERLPVLPGSSLKGAVRQVYEFLTASCTTGCRIGEEKEEPKVCPVCSLFGTSGLAGRVRFGEAEPLADAAGGRGLYEVMERSAHGGWTEPAPPRAERRNKLRVYGTEEADWGQDRLEPTYAVRGRFASRIDLLNASNQELGVLLASLGVGWRGAGPGLRLGGKKYHGLGGVTVSVAVVEGRYPRMRLEGAQLGGGRPIWRKGNPRVVGEVVGPIIGRRMQEEEEEMLFLLGWAARLLRVREDASKSDTKVTQS